MVRCLIALLIAVSTLALPGSAACSCQAGASACQEVAIGSTVFVGTVASISPSFLDHWNLSRRQFLSEMVASEIRYKDENSPAALQALKKRFREAFADLPRPLAQRLDAARTHEALLQVFDSV